MVLFKVEEHHFWLLAHSRSKYVRWQEVVKCSTDKQWEILYKEFSDLCTDEEFRMWLLFSALVETDSKNNLFFEGIPA